MGERQLLIVGIDPGTTLGYAAIDFEGNIINLNSEKNLDLSALISSLIKLGKPLIIAGDKEYNPDFIGKLAIKLGARIIAPDYDLKVNEKREITKEHKTKNQHEIDALASALFALKKTSSLLKKINIFVEHYKKENIKHNDIKNSELLVNNCHLTLIDYGWSSLNDDWSCGGKFSAKTKPAHGFFDHTAINRIEKKLV